VEALNAKSKKIYLMLAVMKQQQHRIQQGNMKLVYHCHFHFNGCFPHEPVLPGLTLVLSLTYSRYDMHLVHPIQHCQSQILVKLFLHKMHAAKLL